MKSLSNFSIVMLLVAAFGLVFSGCGKDEKPKGSAERTILSISFEGQVGNVSIQRPSADVATVSFTWDITSGNKDAVVVKAITVSEGATASVNAGGTLNFSNGNTATIVVTAENGEKLNWVVTLTDFDPDSDLQQGNDILSISFEGHNGDVVIDNATKEITFVFNAFYNNIASVKVLAITLSEKATSSVNAGAVLDFSNPLRAATVNVTAEIGLQEEWTLIMKDVNVEIEGKWAINNTWIFGGNNYWGGAAVFGMTQKSGRWNQETGAIAEHDNIIEFIIDGVETDGTVFGTLINDPGADGLFADYLYFAGHSNNQGPNGSHYPAVHPGGRADGLWDLNYIYRAIPKETAKWKFKFEERDVEGTSETKNMAIVTFIFSDDSERECEFGGRADFGGVRWGEKYNDYQFPDNEQVERINSPMADEMGQAAVDQLMAGKAFFFTIPESMRNNVHVDDWGDDRKYLEIPMFYWYGVTRVTD